MIKKIYYLLLLLILISSSCIRYRDITYFRDVARTPNDSIFKNSFKEYKIQIADVLYIKVTTLEESINAIFNQASSQGQSSLVIGGFYVIGYPVDVEGNIALPIIGKVPVAGLTVKQIQTAVEKQSEKFLTNAKIDVRLVSFKITLLGQLNHVGQINVFADRANIFEALALGGDISTYGNRHTVLILRPDKSGGSVAHRFDLSNRSILTSEYFYLQPNDIIYVEPMKITGFRLSISDYALLISALTTTVSIIFLIKNLYK